MQIPITDKDYPFAKYVLPHQMRVIGKYAADVLISIDRYGRPEEPDLLDALLDKISKKYTNIRIQEVDYSKNARKWVSRNFFGGKSYPLCDWKGISIHASIEPFRNCNAKHVFRLECDMMLGGSGPWFNEALEVLESDSRILAVNPIAGPIGKCGYHSNGSPYDTSGGAGFKVNTFTTRTYLIELERFMEAMNPLGEIKPDSVGRYLAAIAAGYPTVEHAEVLYEKKMNQLNMYRVDMGGSNDLWTLHPVFKTQHFLDCVQQIIEKVETGNIPTEQIGKFDLHSSLLKQNYIPSKIDRYIDLLMLPKCRIASYRNQRDVRSHTPDLSE